MDAKTRLQHIKSVAIRPKKNGQIRNLYNKDFDFLIERAELLQKLNEEFNNHIGTEEESEFIHVFRRVVIHHHIDKEEKS
jgi:hypothetical protein